MEITATLLDNLALGFAVLAAIIGLIVVVNNCRKIENKVNNLERRFNAIEKRADKIESRNTHYMFPPPPYTEEQMIVLRELLTEFGPKL